MTFRRNGFLGNRLKYVICRDCGAVLYQCVAEPLKVSGGRIISRRSTFDYDLTNESVKLFSKKIAESYALSAIFVL